MANEFIIRKGYKSLASSEITGSLNVSTDVTSSDVFIDDWNSVSASLSTLTTDLDVLENKNLLSGSAQIASDISGSITSFSASVSTRFEGLTTDYTELDNIPDDIVSSSAQIASDISGSITSFSGSIAGRVKTNESSISSLNGATGSYLLNTTDTLTGNLTVTGTLTAQEFHTEFVSASILFDSGSTKFGDSSDDIHSFTGSIALTGSGITIKDPATPALNLIDETNNLSLKFRIANNYGYIDVDQGGSVGSSRLLFRTDGYQFLYGDQNQNVFIPSGSLTVGTTSSTAPLTIKSNSASSQDSGITIQANGSTDAIIKLAEKSGNGGRLHMFDGGVEKIAFYTDGTDNHISAGNVGIGTTSPKGPLDVYVASGNANAYIRSNTDNAYLYIDSNLDGAGREESGIIFSDSGSAHWAIYKDSGDDFSIYDYTGGYKAFEILDNGRMDLMPGAAKDVTLVTGGGNVGIGTTAPSTKLTVDGKVTVDHVIGSLITGSVQEWNSYSGVSGNTKLDLKVGRGSNNKVAIFQATYEGGGYSDIILQDQGGNVGIGTTSPSSRFQVKDTQDSSFDSGISIIRSNSSQTGYINMVGGAMNINAPSNIPIKIRDGGTANVTISGDGKVGIGTESPLHPLHVAGEISGSDLYIDAWGSVSASLTSIATAGGVNGSGTTNDIAMWSAANTLTDAPIAISGNNATFAGDVSIGPKNNATVQVSESGGATVKMLAGSVGRVGTYSNNNFILTTNSQNALTLDTSQNATFVGDITTNGDITIDNSSGDPFLKLKTTAQEYVARIDQSDGEKFQIRDTTNSATRLTIDTSGNVGIGTTNPNYELVVRDSSDNSWAQVITGGTDKNAGSIYTNDAGSWTVGIRGADSDKFYIGNQIGLSAAEFAIDTSGNVGIGTTSPIGDLHVVGKTGTAGRIYISDVDDGTATGDSVLAMKSGIHAYYYNRDSGNLYLGTNDDSNQLVINNSGNVGIGTTSPSVQLDIEDSGNVLVDLNTTSANANTTIRFQEAGSVKATMGYEGTSDVVLIANGGFTAGNGINIDGSNNVGIGTATPGAKLDVHGRVDFANDFRLRGSDATADLGVVRFFVDNTDKLTIDAGNDGSNLFTINSSGNVGIGTTSVDGELDVHSDNGRWRVNGYGGMYFRNDSNSTHENYIHARSNGDLSIGRIATGSLTGTGINTYADTTHDQIHINANGTIELPAYGAGYLKADANGVITSDSVVDDAANADTVDSKHATDFTLDYVTGNGSSTSNSIQVGDLEVQNSGIPILTLDDNGNSGGGGAQALIRFKNNAGIMTGIGTTDDETDNSDLLISTNANSTYGGYLGLQTAGITDTQADIVLDALTNIILAPESGSVGIGTSSPAKPLHVRTTGAGEQIISIFENSENADETKASIQLRNATNDVCSTKIISHRTGANFGADLTFELSDDVDGSFQERMRITEIGRVGIGTDSPAVTLHVNGFARFNGGIQLDGNTRTIYAIDNTDLLLGANNAEKMRITAAGNVGIGTDSPVDNYASGITPETTKLAVYGGTSSGYTEVAHFAAGSDANDTGATVRIGHVGNDRGMFIKAGRGTSDQAKALLGVRKSDNTDETILTMQQGGNVGIGDSTPSYKLDVAGTGRFTSNLLVEGTLTETSAKRFKENIQPLESQLENIEKLNPVSFDWKKDGKSDIGLIAEEVKEIIPTLVSEEDGEVKGIQYTKLTAILIKAVQEQQKQINELKEEIFILKKK